MNKNTEFYYEKLKSSLNDDQIVLLDQLVESQVKGEDNPYTWMQGTALLDKLKAGVFPDSCYIVVHSPNGDQLCIIYYSKAKGFRWKPGTFNAGWFIDSDYSFSVLDYSFSTTVPLPGDVIESIEKAIENVIKQAAGV